MGHTCLLDLPRSDVLTNGLTIIPNEDNLHDIKYMSHVLVNDCILNFNIQDCLHC